MGRSVTDRRRSGRASLRYRATRMFAALLVAAIAVLLLATAATARPDPLPTAETPGTESSSSEMAAKSPIPGIDAAESAVDGITDVVTGNLGASIGGSLVSSMLGPISDSLLDGLTAVIDELAEFIDSTTVLDPMDATFLGPAGPYQAIASFSAALMVGFIFLSVAHTLLTGAPGQALIRLLRDIPLAVLAIIGFPWALGQLVILSNALSGAILPAGDTAKDLLTITLLENLKGMGDASLVPTVLIGVLTFAATVMVYLELVVRVILLHLIEALAPLSFAPMVWAPARDATRKVCELTAAVVLSQPVIFLALRIGLDFLREYAQASPLDLGAWANFFSDWASWAWPVSPPG